MEKELSYMRNLGLDNYVKTSETGVSTMEVAIATIGSSGEHGESSSEKHIFLKEVLESKPVSNIEKSMTPGQYRMWSKIFRNAVNKQGSMPGKHCIGSTQ